MTDLNRLGAALSRAQDSTHPDLSVPTEETIYNVVGLAQERLQARATRQKVATLGSVLALCAVLLLWFAQTVNSDLTFTTGGQVRGDTGTAGKLDDIIHVGPEEATGISLDFSDKSRVQLAPGARARVADVSEIGASILLETGRLHLNISPKPENDWVVSAGPFQVAVVGTIFIVEWSPVEERLLVRVERGKVRVRGDFLSEDQVVSGGEQLTILSRQQEVHLIVIGDEDAESTTAEHFGSKTGPIRKGRLPPESQEFVHSESQKGQAFLKRKKTTSNKMASWQSLARDGKAREAQQVVEKLGFSQVAARANAEDLLRLSDVARLSGNGAQASEALHLLRKRFPGTRASGVAAYTLGLVAFNQGAARSAGQWFQLYIKEQAGGSLAREALGRLMEVQRRQGQMGAAKKSAKRYLLSYPQGPHKDVAAGLLRN